MTRRETASEEVLAMPGFPSGLTGMGDRTEIIWRSVPLASFLAVVVEYSRPAKRGVHDANSTFCPVPSSLVLRMRHS